MDSIQPADNAAVSLSRSQPTPGDALCKVAFVDVDVAKVTPCTSCRSTASSDSDESATSSTPTMTSSSRDADDDLPPNSAATWTTYVYFYPRHDMTYTHCLLTTSRHIDCHNPSSTSACWPSLPAEDSTPTGGGWRTGRPGDETMSLGGASQWRRRVNAARTPYWFPVARSYDTAAPAYLCYPRHDLSYAEVEASRIDRQPGVEHSSLPFDTILEELADDASSVDDWSCVLEDRKSVVNNRSDITSVGHTQLPSTGVRDDIRSATSSLSACRSDVPTRTALSPAQHRYDESVVCHEITSSDRWMNPRSQYVDAILTPVTKLDLKILEVVTTRQRVDSGRIRAVVRSLVAEKGRVRRCRSESAVSRLGGRQSPVREMPLSARVVKRKNRFSADDENGVEDVAADGDQWCCSPPAVIPLRAKHAVTCLLLDQPSFNNSSVNLSPRGPTSPPVADVSDDVTVSRRGIRFSVATTSLVTATEDRRHTDRNDQTENVDESLGRTVDVDATVTDNISWKVRTEMTSPDVMSLAADSLTVDWSLTSSEYLTPPTRRYPETTYHTPSVSVASGRATKLCDATSQTPPLDVELNCTEVQTVMHPGNLDERGLVTTSTRLIRNAGSLQTCGFVRPTEVQSSLPSHLEDSQLESRLLSSPEHSSVVNSSLGFTQICDVTSPLSERTVHRAYLSSPECNQRVTASATITRVYNAICQTVDSGVRPIGDQSTQSFYLPDSNTVSDSLTIDDTISPTVLTAAPGTDVHVHTVQSAVLKQYKSVTASATLAPVCDDTLPAVDTVRDVSHGKVPSYLEQSGLDVRDDKKAGRKSWPSVVAVARRLSEAVVRSSDLPSRRSPQHRRPSTLTFRESRTAPAHRPPGRLPNIQRISPQSLADVGGLTAYAASLTPRKSVTSGRAAVDHGVAACHRHRTPSKSYVNIWRKRVATYEAFVNRCQATTTETRTRSQHCA